MNPEETRRHIEHKIKTGELTTKCGGVMLALHLLDPNRQYSDLYREARSVPLPDIAFHTAPASAFSNISRIGLIPTRPESSGNWNRQHGVSSQPEAVYVGAAPDTVGVWSHHSDWSIWAVRTSNLDWHEDVVNEGCWYTESTIHPDALAHLGFFSQSVTR